jgi:hypothetical protein
MEALTERSSEEDLFLNGIIHLAKNATVMARAQARGNLINSKIRLLRRFTPRNDTALYASFLWKRHNSVSEKVLPGPLSKNFNFPLGWAVAADG